MPKFRNLDDDRFGCCARAAAAAAADDDNNNDDDSSCAARGWVALTMISTGISHKRLYSEWSVSLSLTRFNDDDDNDDLAVVLDDDDKEDSIHRGPVRIIRIQYVHQPPPRSTFRAVDDDDDVLVAVDDKVVVVMVPVGSWRIISCAEKSV